MVWSTLPMKIQAEFLYSWCQDADVPAIPMSSSRSFMRLRFLTLVKGFMVHFLNNQSREQSSDVIVLNVRHQQFRKLLGATHETSLGNWTKTIKLLDLKWWKNNEIGPTLWNGRQKEVYLEKTIFITTFKYLVVVFFEHEEIWSADGVSKFRDNVKVKEANQDKLWFQTRNWIHTKGIKWNHRVEVSSFET